jgi:hypothetical protein
MALDERLSPLSSNPNIGKMGTRTRVVYFMMVVRVKRTKKNLKLLITNPDLLEKKLQQ